MPFGMASGRLWCNASSYKEQRWKRDSRTAVHFTRVFSCRWRLTSIAIPLPFSPRPRLTPHRTFGFQCVPALGCPYGHVARERRSADQAASRHVPRGIAPCPLAGAGRHKGGVSRPGEHMGSQRITLVLSIAALMIAAASPAAGFVAPPSSSAIMRSHRVRSHGPGDHASRCMHASLASPPIRRFLVESCAGQGLLLEAHGRPSSSRGLPRVDRKSRPGCFDESASTRFHPEIWSDFSSHC